VKELLDFIVDYGFMTVFAGMCLYFLYKYFYKVIVTKDVTNPNSHNFFNTIDRYKKVTVPGIRVFISSKGVSAAYGQMKFAEQRTRLVKMLLRVKFRNWHEVMKKATEEAVHKKEHAGVRDIYVNAVMKLVDDYESEWRRNMIPEIVITKFNQWHSDHVKVFMSSVDQICLGSSFSSIEEVCNAILHINEGLVVQTILDAERTLGRLNGELSGKAFLVDGQKIILE
jgi:hypothetical protein